MTITELISILKSIKEEHGNTDIDICLDGGEYEKPSYADVFYTYEFHKNMPGNSNGTVVLTFLY